MTKDQLKDLATWLSSFGDPHRNAIVRVLATGEKTVTDIASLLKVELFAITHHLSVMKARGVVKRNRDGRFQRYSLLGAKATAVVIEMTHKSGARVALPLN